jgi:NAD(P)-dependent dehydrogenase (short-subunit alcohol dehydrogenase family)
LETKSFEEGRAWLEAHKDDEATIAFPGSGYMLSKQALILWAKLRAYELSTKSIRINTLSPGTTQTGMTAAFTELYSEDALKAMVTGIGRYATSAEQGEPLVFLNSNMARYISGLDLQVDYGSVAGMESGGAALPALEE